MADETPNDETPPPRRRLRRLLLWLALLAVAVPVGCTAVYRVVPPPLTLLMVQRMGEGHGLARDWVPIEQISPALAWSVIAAEDARFCEHSGFEFEAMKEALEHNEKRPNRIRGGSTVSQQTAKNVFLWPARSYLRKGLEAGFTVLIEALWGKRRIMEVYLNTVEWGPGVYGAQTAARHHFGVDADALSPRQAARLAAILPSPLKWRAAKPGPYVSRRSGRIAAAAGTVRREGLADCLRLAGQAPAPRPPEDRRRAAEEIMEQTAPPPLPDEEDEAAPLFEPAGDAPPAAAPPPPVEPQPLELPPPLEVPPLPAEPPAAP